ncbi:unnamed protein product, partial [Lampetra planeri]
LNRRSLAALVPTNHSIERRISLHRVRAYTGASRSQLAQLGREGDDAAVQVTESDRQRAGEQRGEAGGGRRDAKGCATARQPSPQ